MLLLFHCDVVASHATGLKIASDAALTPRPPSISGEPRTLHSPPLGTITPISVATSCQSVALRWAMVLGFRSCGAAYLQALTASAIYGEKSELTRAAAYRGRARERRLSI